MPTYEYVCSKCGHEFDKFQSMSEKALTVCPKDLCARKKWGRGKLKKKISTGGGLIFKGSGFYVTDYRSDKYKDAAKKDIADSRPPESKSTASESKPAAKSESKPAKSPPKS